MSAATTENARRLTRVGRSLFSSLSQDWRTPRSLYQALDAEFGFTLDPCPTGGTEGLSRSWAGQVVFMNPPYRNVAHWMKKVVDECRDAPATLVVALVAARTDTEWWHDCVLPFASEIRFIRGRLRFDAHPKRGNGSGTAPFASVIVIFGNSKGDARCQ